MNKFVQRNKPPQKAAVSPTALAQVMPLPLHNMQNMQGHADATRNAVPCEETAHAAKRKGTSYVDGSATILTKGTAISVQMAVRIPVFVFRQREGHVVARHISRGIHWQ